MSFDRQDAARMWFMILFIKALAVKKAPNFGERLLKA